MAASEEQRITSIADLNAKVDRLIESIGKGGGDKDMAPAKQEQHAGSLDEQISAAVAKATADQKAKSDADAERQSTQERLKKLEERTERKPVDIRRITKIFWGGADQ